MAIEFFLPMVPPTVTHQEHKVAVVDGKPRFYEPTELKEARAKLTAHLARYRPEQPCSGALRLTTKWIWPRGRYADGTYKITKPDTDNVVKLLKDVMTALAFWKDDAQVASEITEKFWADVPGIYIKVEELN